VPPKKTKPAYFLFQEERKTSVEVEYPELIWPAITKKISTEYKNVNVTKKRRTKIKHVI